jgi:hypothetical protein
MNILKAQHKQSEIAAAAAEKQKKEPIILSWDIGIKNLAYCMVRKCSSDSMGAFQCSIPTASVRKVPSYEILQWGIINLVDNVASQMELAGTQTSLNTSASRTVVYKCNKCKLAAKYMNIASDVHIGYCARHYTQKEKADKLQLYTSTGIPLKTGAGVEILQNKIIDLRAKTCCVTGCQGKSAAAYCLKKYPYMRYCRKHYVALIKNSTKSTMMLRVLGTADDILNIHKYTAVDFLQIKQCKSSNKLHLTDLCRAIMTELGKRPFLLDAQVVLLENQPVLQNPTMKSIQMFVYSFFVLKSVEEPHCRVTSVQCYIATNKLKVAPAISIEHIFAKTAASSLSPLVIGGNGGAQSPPPKKQRKKPGVGISAVIDNVLASSKSGCSGVLLELSKTAELEEAARKKRAASSQKYAKTKEAAIYLVSKLLSKSPSRWLTFWESQKKQDDLADSLLMCLHYLNNH